MSEIASIYELDTERDRKTCLALDLKVTGANRELAQWLLDHHHRYSDEVVAGWLSSSASKLRRLRKWAGKGFVGHPSDGAHPNRARSDSSPVTKEELKSLDNSEDDVADASTIEDNVLHALARMNEHARIFKKFFKLSAFDREAELRIITAIDRMIQKWKSTQSILTRSKRNG